ncbi:leucine-rich repeat receptor protein kinase HPCA1-like [Silene latifolia]|uniref:leucine-rich repeat receptor protein kinase HPCA1-like n=1 Tax=Silene latifolia TaxID=37657 RepID=UPI003D78573D
MSMSLTVAFCLFLVLASPLHVVISETDKEDVAALTALKQLWINEPPTWNNFDPCGNNWDGIVCNGTRVISITLSSMGLKGTLSGDIQELSELQILDLSYNKGMTGALPPAIGKLTKLTNLILIGCSFSGELPDAVGSLTNLIFLSLNSNKFSGSIPNTMGNLSKLYWFDIADNMISGTIPVSNGTTPGLDMLVNTKHFHFGKNQLSGTIPPQLFNENMTLIHLLLDNNQFTGSIPSTLGLVNKLEVVRLDWNMLTGSVPSNISNLTSVTDMLLSNNRLTGPIPDLTGLNLLSYLDMSNNSFEVSDIPSWFSDLPSLTTLVMEKSQMRGEIPAPLFSLPQLETVVMKNNKLSGTLDLGPKHSVQLHRVDLQINNISAYTLRPEHKSLQLLLIGNPICEEGGTIPSYCIHPGFRPTYSTPQECASSACNSNEIASPTCHCGFPYSGVLEFRAPKFSDLQNSTYFVALEKKLMSVFQSNKVAVESVSLSNMSRDSSNYLDVNLEIFPLGQVLFNRTAIRSIGFILSNQTFKPPPYFGPFIFMADEYPIFAEEPGLVSGSEPTSLLSKAVIVGIAIVVCALVLLLLCVGVFFFFCRKTRTNIPVQPAKSTELASSANWMSRGSTSSGLQVTGSRVFPFEDIIKITNNFSQANHIGSGAYGKVYRGTLPNGQLVAVKRAEKGSMRGGLEFKTEFKTEIELLSRVHHKNLVRLLGFCLDNEELILVYEFVPNGTLKGSLSGVSGIRLDWRRRIKVALGAARGLAYLHELASPPIIHRDIKSNNILLDENLNAKVSDFGLSKSFTDAGKGHMLTEVKGTMGYLDPEYYMTQRLSEKSDVYSFGVLMLELITGKSPIDRGRYIVREVKNAMNRTEDLYGLHELLDSDIGLGTTLKGFEKYVDVSLMCVEELGDDRPAMGEVVKQLEDILEMAGLNPYSDSASSTMFDPRHPQHLYGDESLNLYSGSEKLPREEAENLDMSTYMPSNLLSK